MQKRIATDLVMSLAPGKEQKKLLREVRSLATSLAMYPGPGKRKRDSEGLAPEQNNKTLAGL